MSHLLELGGGRSHVVSTFYEATECLGSGRFAEVYKAFDKNSETDVALKIYRAADLPAHEMAGKEAETLAELTKLNTAFFPKLRGRLKTRLKNENHPLLVMELGQHVGSDHRKRIIRLQDVLPERGKQDLSGTDFFWQTEQITEWICDLAVAVRALHSRQVIHRDLKPANILLKRAAGAQTAVPFIIDFNSSTRLDAGNVYLGTERYLPPEVRAGTRLESSVADDLWALGMVLWEMIHGLGAPVCRDAEPHRLFPDVSTRRLREVLFSALDGSLENRFPTSEEFCKALQEAIRSEPVRAADARISLDEFTWARESAERIRNQIVDDLSGNDDLPVPKDVRERVASLYIWLAEEQTRSFDLRNDVLQLGARAVPALIEESYKISMNSEELSIIADAIAQMGEINPGLTDRSVGFFCCSSNIGVRTMSREVCRKRRRIPRQVVDLLLEDDGLLMAAERVDLADLCIQYSEDGHAILVLTKYMCREYLIDRNYYVSLRDLIAGRMGELKFKDRALLVLQDSEQRIWRELDEWKALNELQKAESERGLLELMGDAFASMGLEALALLKRHFRPSLNDEWRKTIWRVFCRKLGMRNRPTQEYLKGLYESSPDDRDLRYVLKPIINRFTPNQDQIDEPLAEVFSRYLGEANSRDFNSLRFSRDNRVFDLIANTLRGTESLMEVERVLQLLAGFEHRARSRVVRVLVGSWSKVSRVDCRKAIDILTKYRVDPGPIFDEVVATLGRELKGANGELARRGLETLLK